MRSVFPTTDPLAVLIVDDDPLHAKLLERALRAKGFDLTVAQNGREALETLREQGQPLVITDWIMPEMDGLELCRQIRDSDEIPFTYIILLTGNTSTEQIEAGFEAGADDYVTKPFIEREVVSRLKAAERIIRLEAFYRKHAVLAHKVNAEVALINGKLERVSRQLTEARDEAVGARAAAEGASRAKSEFLANMGHEIRTPLTSILGFVDVIAEAIDPSHRPDLLEEALEIVRRNGEHLLTILNDLLDLSRIEAGGLHIERVPFSVRGLVESVATVMRRRAQEKQLVLEVEWDPDTADDVLGDPTRLRQVLLNLVGNAVKFTSAGAVRVRVRPSRDDRGDGVELAVVDSGVGIAEDQLTHIFEPFAQGDAGVTRKFGGTGLGLSICKRLVDAMGGTIGVTSKAGGGSTFTVRLAVEPAERPPPSAPVQAAPSAKGSTGKTPPQRVLQGVRILLAEDGEDNRRLIQLLLARAGAHLKCVENGKLAVDEALRGWKTGPAYDVVLMDMQMPVMDGYTAVRALREAGYGAPIVALTAHAMSDDREKCLQAGCDEYVSKPIDLRKLLAAITTLKPSRVEAPA